MTDTQPAFQTGTATSHVYIFLKQVLNDQRGKAVAENAHTFFDIVTGSVRHGKVFSIESSHTTKEIGAFADSCLVDPVVHDLSFGVPPDTTVFESYILVSKSPGVTDDEGFTAQQTFCDFFDLPSWHGEQFIFSHDLYLLERDLSGRELKRLAEDLLGNPLINHFSYGARDTFDHYVPRVLIESRPRVISIPIDLTDEELISLSKRMLLALNLEEMTAIRDHFADPVTREKRRARGISHDPTDCELEVFGQTWSEHCKHKEFNAEIHYRDLDTGERETIQSLFTTYITGATKIVRKRYEAKHANWLLKVFHDNAGVVRIDEERVFIWKVETHNSPSALDPYGGALTGIVGVNRDPLGTGIGGGMLLFNTDVLCFGDPFYDGPLLSGQLHPRRILRGVVKGIEDGGNKSGIPTVNGSLIFDRRFSGKPLVFCGTGAVMPAFYNGNPSWEKHIESGDRIIMAGGRVGRDGIHGATFSSLEIDEHSPRSAVQIGSPITQKNLSDFMRTACRAGLIRCSTDNGAGGLSSSVGELAEIPGGAVVLLERVPLKYPGLQPWEIFVSESQERMTLVVKSENSIPLFHMAETFEVELTDIGYFTDNGYLDVRYNETTVAYLSLDFLHNGVPRKTMHAEWRSPDVSEPTIPESMDHNDTLLRLMGSLNICSRESIIRRYDHEVKGGTVVKPLMGPRGLAPQDAAVVRLDHEGYAGIAVSNGICPRYGDIDPYAMSAGAFDEAVRQIIAVGGILPDPGDNPRTFWSVNDNFCMPDAMYDPVTNPDGKLKLAKLVRMCKALYDMSTFFNIPMTSGKDSMKNDFVGGGEKISIPPTILYSMAAYIPDIRRTVTAEFKKPGHLVYLVGHTFPEMGGSEFFRLLGSAGVTVPAVRMELARRVYGQITRAMVHGCVASCHDLSDGGFAVAAAESALGSGFGCTLTLEGTRYDAEIELFSESHSRFIVSVFDHHARLFEEIMGDDCRLIGMVTEKPRIIININSRPLIDISLEEVTHAWTTGLEGAI